MGDNNCRLVMVIVLAIMVTAIVTAIIVGITLGIIHKRGWNNEGN